MINREIFEVTNLDDFTSKDNWVIDNEIYNFIKSYLIHGDGECHEVIVQRQSDNKYFAFSWGYHNGNYYYEPIWEERFPKLIINTDYE